MASEWLELDAADDWVRHDAEIVNFELLCFSIPLLTPIVI